MLYKPTKTTKVVSLWKCMNSKVYIENSKRKKGPGKALLSWNPEIVWVKILTLTFKIDKFPKEFVNGGDDF